MKRSQNLLIASLRKRTGHMRKEDHEVYKSLPKEIDRLE